MAALDTVPDQARARAREVRDPQEAVAALRTRVERVRSQLAEEDLGARAQQATELATERAQELEETVRARLEDLEPAARTAELGLWRALRALFGGLAALPALIFTALRAVAGTLDDVADRTDLEERARRAGRLLPDRRPPRVRRRTALLWTAGGVGVGFVGGWLLARRRASEVVFEDPQPEVLETSANGAWQRDAALRE
jgi:hypothetical protein